MVVLYRKYRPQKLTELVGQSHVTDNLLTSLKSGKISHAYLFTGPRGTGKTTTARIIAKMLNCDKNHLEGDHSATFQEFNEPCNECDACIAITNGSYLDVLEIDAASNRGIDDIRDLREKVKLAPTYGNYKVYIIDEVHMLTGEAFNALLKTLEEPPEKTIFILCTTDLKKVPETIVSRCQKFEFKKAKKEDLLIILEKITKTEKIEIEVEALSEIAKAAGGGFRDAVSLLDQVVTGNENITTENVRKNLSLSPKGSVEKILKLIKAQDAKHALSFIREYSDAGRDVYDLIHEMIIAVENELLVRVGVGETDLEVGFSLEELKLLAKNLIRCEAEMKFSFRQELPLELLVVEWCKDKIKENPGNPEPPRETSRLTMEAISEKWPDFLSALKPFNHSLESILRKCEMQKFDGLTLTLAVYYKLHKDVLMDTKNLRIINKCLSDVVGDDVKVILMLKEKPKVVKSEVDENNEDNLADKAMELFK